MSILDKGYSQTKIVILILLRLLIWLIVVTGFISVVYSPETNNLFPDALLRQHFKLHILASQGPLRTRAFRVSRTHSSYDIVLRDHSSQVTNSHFAVNVKIINKNNQVINEYNDFFYKKEEDSSLEWRHKVFKNSKNQQLYLQLNLFNDQLPKYSQKGTLELIISPGNDYLVSNYFISIASIAFLLLVIVYILYRLIK